MNEAEKTARRHFIDLEKPSNFDAPFSEPMVIWLYL